MAVFRAIVKISLSIAALALVGCSRLDIGMRWVDTIAMSKIDDYFVLDSKEDKAARAEFNSAFDQIRREEFPKIADGLDDFVAKTEAGQVSRTYLDKVFADADALWARMMARFEPMGQKLVEEQIEKAEDGVDRLVDESVADLTDEQEKSLAESLKKQPPGGLIQLENRKAVFEEFKKIRADAAKRKDYFRRFFTDWQSVHTPAYPESRKAGGGERFKRWLTQAFMTITEKQKKHLAANFRKRAAEFREQAGKK